jgi:hypothetical protein
LALICRTRIFFSHLEPLTGWRADRPAAEHRLK